MKRWLFLAYGVAGHATFLATFAYLACFVGNFLVPKTIDAPAGGDTVQAVSINLLLVAVFALQHSVMARPAFKRIWTRLIPQPIERATYVWLANAVTILLMWQWQPINTIVWHVEQTGIRAAIWSFFAAGWLAVPLVSLMINHFDLFGTRQVLLFWQNKPYKDLPFRTPAFYAYVRHPLYLGWGLAFWAAPTMTVGHLLFAGSMTVYMILAAFIEERDLISHFGDTYQSYRRRVPMFVPKAPVWVSRVAMLAVSAIGVTVLLLWLAGRFAPKVSTNAVTVSAHDKAVGITEQVRFVQQKQIEPAVGTVRPIHETTIGTRLLARVVEVNLKAGQVVKSGDILVRLDDSDLRAKQGQAEAVLRSAEAAYEQARLDAKRTADLLRSKAVSRQEDERATTALKAAEAELSRVKESLREIRATLDWATIQSPLNGIVIEKRIDVGDTVTPGQMLATLCDPKKMQLVATVRESLAYRLKVGQQIRVQIENFSTEGMGTISEIVPEAEPSSRAFQVKVTGPCPDGIYSGMFGRIQIPLDEEQILVVSRNAVESIGQLDFVKVVTAGGTSRRAIRLGRTIGQDVEVLSGLSLGESVQVPAKMPLAGGADHG